jgi:hypothetical protein
MSNPALVKPSAIVGNYVLHADLLFSNDFDPGNFESGSTL